MSGAARARRGRGGQDGHEPRARIRTRERRAMELTALGWSQYQIAVDLGVSQVAVSKILTRVEGRVAHDDRVDRTAAYQLFGGDVAYVWHAGLFAASVAASLEVAGFVLRSQIIWAKQHFALSRGDYH